MSETESKNRYGITNNDSGALGRYQVMPANVPRWSKKVLGIEATPEQFLASSAVQDAVVYGIINDAWKRFGNFRDVASEWHSGDPYAKAIARNATDGDMKTVDYVAKTERDFIALMGRCSAGGSDWACPADETFVLSDFGPRTLEGKPSDHDGIDIPGPVGNPNYAVAAGTVVEAGSLGSNGKCGLGVQIDHGNGLHTIHCHLSKTLVKTGELVTRKQVIGLIGTTGHITGPHTHFAVLKNGKRVDPERYLSRACVNGTKTSPHPTLIAHK